MPTNMPAQSSLVGTTISVCNASILIDRLRQQHSHATVWRDTHETEDTKTLCSEYATTLCSAWARFPMARIVVSMKTVRVYPKHYLHQCSHAPVAPRTPIIP